MQQLPKALYKREDVSQTAIWLLLVAVQYEVWRRSVEETSADVDSRPQVTGNVRTELFSLVSWCKDRRLNFDIILRIRAKFRVRFYSATSGGHGEGFRKSKRWWKKDKEEDCLYLFGNSVSVNIFYSSPDYRPLSDNEDIVEESTTQFARLDAWEAIALIFLEPKDKDSGYKLKVNADNLTTQVSKTVNQVIRPVCRSCETRILKSYKIHLNLLTAIRKRTRTGSSMSAVATYAISGFRLWILFW